MSLLAFAELWAAYFAAALIVSFGVTVAWVHLHGVPPLLDGSPLRSALDDSDRRRMLVAHLEADRAPDLFAVALEEIRNLPTRQHP